MGRVFHRNFHVCAGHISEVVGGAVDRSRSAESEARNSDGVSSGYRADRKEGRRRSHKIAKKFHARAEPGINSTTRPHIVIISPYRATSVGQVCSVYLQCDVEFATLASTFQLRRLFPRSRGRWKEAVLSFLNCSQVEASVVIGCYRFDRDLPAWRNVFPQFYL